MKLRHIKQRADAHSQALWQARCLEAEADRLLKRLTRLWGNPTWADKAEAALRLKREATYG